MEDADAMLDIMHDNERINELKIIFEIYDTDSDGFVNIQELGNIMKSMGYELSQTELEDMINEVSKIKNQNKLNFEIFMLIMNKRGGDADIVEEYTEAFRVFDREGNGFINKEELRQILLLLGEKLPEDDVDIMLRDADVNNDGKIEYRKFVRLMLFK